MLRHIRLIVDNVHMGFDYSRLRVLRDDSIIHWSSVREIYYRGSVGVSMRFVDYSLEA